MKVLEVKNVGPIKHAQVEFGDLTILVGPQASGKSVFLQMLKLVVDNGMIRRQLEDAAAALNGNVSRLFDAYFGAGGAKYWSPESNVNCDGREFDLSASDGLLLENVEFVPAQRAMALTLEGWPRPFLEFPREVPYVLKEYGSELQRHVRGAVRGSHLAPVGRDEFQTDIWSRVENAILPGFAVTIDESETFRRLVLASSDGGMLLPMSMWSAGQRESVPLLLSLAHYAANPTLDTRAYADWLVIEEPEMGLHPDGIMAIMGAIASLLAKSGPMRVCISTHSIHVLDFVWALRVLKEQHAPPESLLGILKLPPTAELRNIAHRVLERSVAIYYFDRDTGETRDISRLDPAGKDEAEAGWGGLTEWSARVGDAVADAVAAARAR